MATDKNRFYRGLRIDRDDMKGVQVFQLTDVSSCHQPPMVRFLNGCEVTSEEAARCAAEGKYGLPADWAQVQEGLQACQPERCGIKSARRPHPDAGPNPPSFDHPLSFSRCPFVPRN